jgi:glutathione-regulated potassium-efflux system ancillary protein KefC
VPKPGEVIVAGLGRVGQVVARMLNAAGYQPTALDDDPDHVEQSRKFGFRVFYGDATRLDLLHAAGADTATSPSTTPTPPPGSRESPKRTSRRCA